MRRSREPQDEMEVGMLEQRILPLFGRHGLAGLVIGVLFLLVFYQMSKLNTSINENTAVLRELKTLIQVKVANGG